MPTSQSMSLTRRGLFRNIYRNLKREGLLATTPIIFCEGDSWFSTPLAMNLLDWIVSPAPQDEMEGVPLLGKGGLFFRAEHSGDHASFNALNPKRSMFVEPNINDLMGWFKHFEFDVVLLSAGGNDFVADFLRATFADKEDLLVEEALQCVRDTRKFETVRDAYALFIQALLDAKPSIQILSHTYAYPVRINEPGSLTLGNVGVAAALKKSVGPWIGPHVAETIRQNDEGNHLQLFAKGLIDAFESDVLRAVKEMFPNNFDYVDLRPYLAKRQDWFDEMHPTEAGFHELASVFRARLIEKIPARKR